MASPFLLRHNERLLCIPESNEAEEVCLYALDEHRLGWTREAVLIKGRRLVDSTVLLHEGRWWLFATDEENGPNTKLLATDSGWLLRHGAHVAQTAIKVGSGEHWQTR